MREPRSIRFNGYRKESATGIPTFLFQVDDVPVEQRVLSFGHDQVTIELSFPDDNRSTRFYRMDPGVVASVDLSERLRTNDAGVIEIPVGESWAQIRLNLKPTGSTSSNQFWNPRRRSCRAMNRPTKGLTFERRLTKSKLTHWFGF